MRIGSDKICLVVVHTGSLYNLVTLPFDYVIDLATALSKDDTDELCFHMTFDPVYVIYQNIFPAPLSFPRREAGDV